MEDGGSSLLHPPEANVFCSITVGEALAMRMSSIETTDFSLKLAMTSFAERLPSDTVKGREYFFMTG